MKTKLFMFSVGGSLVLTFIGVMSIINQFKMNDTSSKEITLVNESVEQIEKETAIKKDPVVFDGLTLKQLSKKLNKSLSSDLAGYGDVYASYAIKKGVNPYLAVAITLHETGCKWGCSSLVKNCNNVGGIKGSPSCNGGSYKYFDSLEDGIKSYINLLYKGYISKGLTTPYEMQRKYTGGSTTWASKVNSYMKKIKAK